MEMYHYYNQKQPPTLEQIANAPMLERLFYYASMEIDLETQQEQIR